MILTTERLVLKPYTMDCLEKLNKWRNDKELLYYNSDIPESEEPIPLDVTRKSLEKMIEEKDGDMIRFGIHKKSDDAMIGFCMLAFVDTYNKSCKLGLNIGEKEEWGKGYGKEVLEALIGYGFGELGLNRIGAEIYGFNERSLRLFESVGFKREGIIRQCVWKKGRFEDEYVYGLLNGE